MVDSPRHRDRMDSAQSSRSSSISKTNRKARRAAKVRELKEGKDVPSESNESQALPEAGPSTLAKIQDVTAKTSTSFEGDDFIAFTFSEEENEAEEGVEEEALSTREWDKGKAKAKDRDHGRKRRHDEIDFNDGYTNKKQRTDAASRLAPWAGDVDWERSKNVSEM
jgi:non-canonical poly(A) RNA polymerase PAPD5/7